MYIYIYEYIYIYMEIYEYIYIYSCIYLSIYSFNSFVHNPESRTFSKSSGDPPKLSFLAHSAGPNMTPVPFFVRCSRLAARKELVQLVQENLPGFVDPTHRFVWFLENVDLPRHSVVESDVDI